MNKPAYLEISGRMTGKTTRLVGFAEQLSGQGRTVVMVTPLHRFLPRLRGVTYMGYNHARHHIAGDDRLWMFDEFDYYPGVPLLRDAYYATTPRFVRTLRADAAADDVLLQLIAANGGSYIRHHLLPHQHDVLPEVRRDMRPDEFRLTMLGEFLA